MSLLCYLMDIIRNKSGCVKLHFDTHLLLSALICIGEINRRRRSQSMTQIVSMNASLISLEIKKVKKNTLLYNVCRLCLPKMCFRYENVIHYLVMFIHVMSVKFYFIKKVTYTEWLFWNINGDSKTYKMVFGKVSCAATFMNTIWGDRYFYIQKSARNQSPHVRCGLP